MADNPNKKDAIEEFFQKKAEEYDIAYREEDWQKLEHKLDLRDAKVSYQRKVRWIAAASILIVSLLGYFTYQNYSRINQINQLLDEEVAETSEPDNILENPGADNSPVTDSEETTQPEDINQVPAPENDNLLADQSQENTRNDTPAPPETTADTEIEIEEEPEIFLPSRDTETELITSRLDGMEQLPAEMFVSEPSPPGEEFEALATASMPDRVSATPAVQQAAPVYKLASSSRIAVGLLMSPDFSTVGSASNFRDPGFKFGLALNYQLTPRLSVTTGIVQAKIHYAADGQDYRPPAGWNSYIPPNQVDAECTIIDIPLNVNYSFMEFGKSRLFASAGLSSYIMRDENYSFEYDYYNPGQAPGWSGQTGTRHWFSNVGFSIGYQLDVHQNWSFQVEPYIKVPVREVGWGNVKLYSVGSFISVNYKL